MIDEKMKRLIETPERKLTARELSKRAELKAEMVYHLLNEVRKEIKAVSEVVFKFAVAYDLLVAQGIVNEEQLNERLEEIKRANIENDPGREHSGEDEESPQEQGLDIDNEHSGEQVSERVS